MSGKVDFHAVPNPVRLGRKVRKRLAVEIAMDATAAAEEHWLPDPAELEQLIDVLREHLGIVREVEGGVVGEWGSINLLRKVIERKAQEIRDDLASEVLRVADAVGGSDEKVAMERNIRRLVKRGRRLSKAGRECKRYMDEWREFDRDREAAERLGWGAEVAV